MAAQWRPGAAPFPSKTTQPLIMLHMNGQDLASQLSSVHWCFSHGFYAQRTPGTRGGPKLPKWG
eukprot:3182927-Rhodomonas_salina.1